MRESVLRERQAAAAREEILDRLLELIEGEEIEELPVEELARRVGVSRRTLYRYFPTREALLAAAGERYVTRLGLPEKIDGADAIAESFAEANRRLAERPALARALVRSAAGRSLRAGPRQRRVRAIEAALDEITRDLPASDARRGSAVVSHLCGLSSWIALQDETGLDGDDSREALVWALDALVSTLRRQARNRPRGEESR